MNQPLKYWYCDIFDEKFDKVEQGYVIWKTDNSKAYNFKIIHQGRCDDKSCISSSAQSEFLGPKGLSILLSKLSLGPILNNIGHLAHCKIDNFEEFVDLLRRVQVPHYEEARRNFKNQDVLYNYNDADEVYPYLPEQLEIKSNYDNNC